MAAAGNRTENNHREKVQKVFIQRDYSEGTNVKFQTKFPTELEGLIDRHLFEQTINTLNRIYAEAEKTSTTTFCESCLACLTSYVIYLCIETHYQKCLKRISAYLDDQNETVYLPRGLVITDPIERVPLSVFFLSYVSIVCWNLSIIY
ncbi:golgin subfamily A member 7 [Caerostris darwini]|uniref:Ras modification protein ERF4 n=1 Tax=Caerostris darwini TaxID=1538125 RepID=A0AAV4P7B4_9ARAC|nr:golgin subfamily A member 7 [Caerostris darwini]